MIDAASILERVRQGEIPKTWHLIYGPEYDRRRAWRSKNPRWERSVLVMMPEGCVESADEKKTIKSVSYASLERLILKMVTSDSSEGRRRTHTMPIMVVLELHYKDGKIELWRLDQDFGFGEEIAQQIIAAHRRFHEGTSRLV